MSATRQCLSGQWMCLLLLSILILSTFPFFAVEFPLSHLYKGYHKSGDTFQLAKQMNSVRLQKAHAYWKEVKKSLEFYQKNHSHGLDLVVAIVTVGRDQSFHETGYLIQTAAVVDMLVKTDTYFKNMVVFVCNVDEHPAKHSDAVFLQAYIPYVQKFGSNSFNRSFSGPSFKANHRDSSRGKEVEDYIFCLNVSYSFNSSYVLVLEDDVLANKNMFEVLHYTLKQHSLEIGHDGVSKIVKGRTFSSIKIYYPEKWQGYAFELDRVMELVSLGLIGGALVLGFLTICSQSRPKYVTKLFYFAFGTTITIVSASVIGRQQVMSLRHASPQLYKFGPTPKCCTPAMFYTSSILPDLTDYLKKHSDTNKDIAMHQFVDQIGIPGYQLEPNLVRHIGMYTSLQEGHKAPEEFLVDIPL